MGGPKAIERKAISQEEATRIKIFCFAWTAQSRREEEIMPYARNLFSACDGYAFFTDRDAKAGGEGVIKVDVPRTQQKRTDSDWLLLKNMVGLMPSLKHLLDSGLVDGYDWLVNAELDHFLVAPLLRQTIRKYTNAMINGAIAGQDPYDNDVLLVFGNVFLFNAKF